MIKFKVKKTEKQPTYPEFEIPQWMKDYLDSLASPNARPGNIGSMSNPYGVQPPTQVKFPSYAPGGSMVWPSGYPGSTPTQTPPRQGNVTGGSMVWPGQSAPYNVRSVTTTVKYQGPTPAPAAGYSTGPTAQQTRASLPFQGYGSGSLPPWGYGPPPPSLTTSQQQAAGNYQYGGTAYDDQGYTGSNLDQYLKSRGQPPSGSSYWRYGATPKWSSGVPRLPGSRGTGQRNAYRSPVQPGIGRTDQTGGGFSGRMYGFPGGTQYFVTEGEMKDEVLRQLYAAGAIPNPFTNTPSAAATKETPGNAKYADYYNSLIAWRNSESVPRREVVPTRRESSRTRR